MSFSKPKSQLLGNGLAGVIGIQRSGGRSEKFPAVILEMFDIEHEIRRVPSPPGPLSAEVAADFVDLLGRMLKYRYSERITTTEILEHPWLNKEYDESGKLEGPWIQTYDPGRLDWGMP
jgi:serine/threonine protein kinase